MAALLSVALRQGRVAHALHGTHASRTRKGVPRVDVVCPGFASDCLETIEEINDEARRAYEESVGEGRFEYIPALNACDDAVALYARLTLEALGRKA